MKHLYVLFIILTLGLTANAQSSRSIRLNKHRLSFDTVYYGEKSKVEHFTIYNITNKGVELNISSPYSFVSIQNAKHFLDAKDSVTLTVVIYFCKLNIFPTHIVVGTFNKNTNDTIIVTGKLYKRNGECKDYWGNGKLKWRKHYRDGELDGEYTEWYDNGQIKCSGNYLLGMYPAVEIKDNIFNRTIKASPFESRPSGIWNYYYENGNKSATFQYGKDGMLNGVHTSWYKNGTLKEEEESKNGMHYGFKKEYFENGKLFAISYVNKNTQYGEWKTWYENGELQSHDSYDTIKNTVIKEKWYRGQKLKSKEFLVKGKRTGEQTEFYENGNMKSKSFYVNGEADGVQETYYENGKIMCRTIYKNGRPIDKQECFYENGTMKSRMTIVKGQSPIFECWDESGNIIPIKTK